jgi:CheY-like chemotaxis protein
VARVPYGTPEDEILRLSICNRESLKDLKLVAILDMDATVDSDAIEKARFSASLRRPITQSRLIDAIAEASLAATESIAVTPASGDTAQNNLQGLHLLVAEDNEMNQFVTRETLKRAGCTCDVVSDGALALEASAKKRYDLILMDCQMPGMDGLEATIRIRERELADGEPRIPIIALTAEAIQGDREKCLAAGMDDYVTKPINAGELFRAIGALKSTTASPITTPTAPAAAPALPSIEDPFDLAALLKRCMKDAKFAVNTLIKFRERACSDVQLLQQRLAGCDGQSIQNIAHNLKSAAAHVGANPLRRIANDIEQLSTEFNAEALSQKLLELNAEVKRCAEYIPQAIEDLSKAEEGSCKS